MLLIVMEGLVCVKNGVLFGCLIIMCFKVIVCVVGNNVLVLVFGFSKVWNICIFFFIKVDFFLCGNMGFR